MMKSPSHPGSLIKADIDELVDLAQIRAWESSIKVTQLAPA
jgi:hypothetical protein